MQRQLHLPGSPRCRQGKARSELAVKGDTFRPYVGVALHGVTQNRTGADRRHARNPRIVHVQDGETRGGQRRHQFALGPGHAVEIAEELHMRHGHTGDDTDIGTAHVGQAGDVAGASRSHLQDDPLNVVGSIDQGQREAQLVVEGPLAGRHAEGRRQAAAEQILRRRLAHRAGDADHRALHAVAGDRTQTKERHGGVLDHDRRRSDGFPCGEIGRGSPLEGRADELVPVALGDDGDVELPRHCRPGVDARSRHGDIGTDVLPTESGCEFRSRKSHASRSRSIV